MIKNMKWLALVVITMSACTKSDDPIIEEKPDPITAGEANFSKYVALGDSFAAGYQDGALYKKAQETSYPNILAEQFKLAGGGAFETPWMKDDIGGFSLNNVQHDKFLQRLYFDGKGPASVGGVTTTLLGEHVTGTAFNNLGIPGARSFHLLYNEYAIKNPYFGRMATSSSATVLGDALAQNPTFFSLWIGGNDALAFATGGGVESDVDNQLTDAADFEQYYETLVSQLAANGRKGVVANLPYVNSLPYFTTVPFNPITAKILGKGDVAVGNATIDQLNAQLYGLLHAALTALQHGDRINVLSKTTANPMLIKDETLPDLSTQLTAVFKAAQMSDPMATILGQVFGQVRQTNKSDFVLLPTQSKIGVTIQGAQAPLNVWGVTYPLEDKDVLIPSEITAIKTATNAYNATIQKAATKYNLAFVDTEAVMNQLMPTELDGGGGIAYDGYILKTDYIFGGAFSLDGVHPTARGYAMISNLFIDAINAKYKSNIPKVKLTNYPTLRPKTY